MNETIRVRFAPSPTGHLHIGNARTAVLNWLFARHAQGRFVLRIEDTDRERSSPESEASILQDLRWLGLDWDEGPEAGGPYGPYRQSERLEHYRDHVRKLAERGQAYACYCSESDLERRRRAALNRGQSPNYDRRCWRRSAEEKARLQAEGRTPVWRFYVRQGEVKWTDLVKGEVRVQGENVGDFVILRSDGVPTYNFAAVVDDHLMAISHVVRGDDHISNTPKQLLLYEAFGWEAPQFGHIPMILGPARARLSKRHGATSVAEFRERGYLPEALINFLSLLSWSSESGEEILSVERLIAEFSFERVNRAPAIFDLAKFNWMNGYYLRHLPLDKLAELAEPFFHAAGLAPGDRERFRKILDLVRDGVDTLSELPTAAALFYEKRVNLSDGEAIAMAARDTSQKIFWAFLRHLENFASIDAATFRAIMKDVQKETGILGKDLWQPIRVALTGKLHGPDLGSIAEILGKNRCAKRVRDLLD